mgnify:CR=1 FL=1
MSKKGIGILLIIIGILGGLYLYVLVGFLGSIGFAGGLIYGGYKLYTAKNFELVSEKIKISDTNDKLFLEICVKNLSDKEGQICISANIYNKEQIILTVATNTLMLMPQETGILRADINVNLEEINIKEITHKIISCTVK